MSNLLPVVIFGAAIIALVSLLGAIFGKKNRKRRLGYFLGGIVTTLVAAIFFGTQLQDRAESAGFASFSDQAEAERAGVSDAAQWEALKAEEAEKVAEAIAPVVALVTEATQAIPSDFDMPAPIPADALTEPLRKEVLAYARFYWVVDQIEANCHYLGQRSNIEKIDPGTGVSGWVAWASMKADHPNYAEYLAITDAVAGVVQTVGEEAFCPEMYRLLGPGGDLMDEAIKVNGLIDPEIFDRYEVKVEDGILWSSRDYCERRFHLEPPAQQDMHDLACKEAKEQGF